MRENKDRKRFQERQAVLLKELEGLEKLESELKGKAGELHSQRKLLEALRPLHELLFFQGELAQRWHESFKPSGYGQNVGPWTDWVKRQDLKAVQGKAFAEMSRQLGNPLHHLSAIQELGVAGASTRVDLLERRFFQEVDGELAQRWDSGVKRLERLVKSDANVSKLVSEDGSLAGKVRTLLAGKPKPTVAMADKIAGNEKEYEQKRREFREGSEAMESSFAAREKELHDAKASLEIRRTGAGARIQETQARISGIEAGEAEHARQVGLWKRVRAEKRLLPAARFTTAELKALHALGQQLRDAPEVLAFRGFDPLKTGRTPVEIAEYAQAVMAGLKRTERKGKRGHHAVPVKVPGSALKAAQQALSKAARLPVDVKDFTKALQGLGGKRQRRVQRRQFRWK